MAVNPADKHRREQKQKQKAANKARRQEGRQARAYLSNPAALEREVAGLHAKDQASKKGLRDGERVRLEVLRGQVEAVKRCAADVRRPRHDGAAPIRGVGIRRGTPGACSPAPAR